MKLFFNTITLFLLLFNTMACKVNTKAKEKEEPPKTIINYRKAKGRCMKCPQFTIDVLTNRTAIYEGKANVPSIGKKVFPLSEKQFQRILTQFEQSNFTAFERLYLSNRRDAPRMVLVYEGHEVSTQKKVCPTPLMDLIELIESVIPIENRIN